MFNFILQIIKPDLKSLYKVRCMWSLLQSHKYNLPIIIIKNLEGLEVKSCERKLFQLLHLEVIVGSFHSLNRANNTQNWTKTALNGCIEKNKWCNVSGTVSQKLQRSLTLKPILCNFTVVNKIEFNILHWKSFTYGSQATLWGSIKTCFSWSVDKWNSLLKLLVAFRNCALIIADYLLSMISWLFFCYIKSVIFYF